jgi:hypothetical protein
VYAFARAAGTFCFLCCFCFLLLTENAALQSAQPRFKFVVSQWQPPQVEQLPVQAAEGSSTVIGSPPFIAVLMIASM